MPTVKPAGKAKKSPPAEGYEQANDGQAAAMIKRGQRPPADQMNRHNRRKLAKMQRMAGR